MTTRATARNLLADLTRTLRRRGADYGEARYERLVHESLVAEDGRISSISLSEHAGIGLRVLVGGSWGFAATPHLTPASLTRTVDHAFALAKAAARVNRARRALAPLAAAQGRHTTRVTDDPFDVPLKKKTALLLAANDALLGPDEIQRATSHMDFFKKEKLLHTTEGTVTEQLIIESGAGVEAVAQRGGEAQVRSYPNSHHGALAQAGFEYVDGLKLVEGAAVARQDAVALLEAPCPDAGETTLILHPTQVVMQLHESCGHPAELDRAFGHELSYAGGSFLTPERLRQLRYGSRHVTIMADATIPGGVGSFAFDDEGVPAQRVALVHEGLFVGYLSSRETASRLSLAGSGGAMRAESWSVPPLIRMTNVNLEPGTATLEELCRDVKHGYLLATNKSWSIDDQRLNFQFTTEIGWEIVRGRIGRLIRNPLYSGITPEFWGRCTGVGRREDWQLWGIPNCAKGEPMQLMHVGHGASYARFDGVTVAPARTA